MEDDAAEAFAATAAAAAEKKIFMKDGADITVDINKKMQ